MENIKVITTSTYTPSFGRAFTTEEKNDYKKLLRASQKELGLRDTEVIVFDFSVPSEKGYNIGIGSTFSKSMIKLTDFMRSMTGITSVQVGPQGKITPENTSPYSGTNYAFGEHIIDLKQLTRSEYAQILSDKDIQDVNKEYFDDKEKIEYRADYDNVIGTETKIGYQERLLKRAYRNFGFGMSIYDRDTAKLDYEFQLFKKDNKDWLEPETMFKLLTEEYGTDDYNEWLEEDRDLYSNSTSNRARQERIDELNKNYREQADFENFKQFLAYKQQQEFKEKLNLRNMNLYGDCLLGFARSEIWANKDCFKENVFYGGPDESCQETNGIQIWGFNAIDFDKLGYMGENGDTSKLGVSGKMLYNKYKRFFERYDGLRIDAAWQFVTPFLYKEEDYDFIKVEAPELEDRIFNIMNHAGKEAMGRKFDISNPTNVMLELIGTSADKSKLLTKNVYPHIYTTNAAEYGDTPEQYKQKGYHKNKFYIGIGNHDNDSLVNISEDEYKRKSHIEGMKRDYNIDTKKLAYNSEEYQNQTKEEKEKEDFKTAKFAELFTTAKQYFTLPDMFGMSQRINIAGRESNENWRVRIPYNYEEFYHSQLSKGYGLNMPKALENAFYMKHIENKQLTEKLAQAAEILRQNGPMTEKAANEAEKKGELKNKFEYKV